MRSLVQIPSLWHPRATRRAAGSPANMALNGGVRMALVSAWSVALVGVLSVLAGVYDRFPGDLAVADGIQSIATPRIDDLMEAVSLVGSGQFGIAMWSVVVVVVVIARRWRTAILLVAAAPTPLLVRLLKEVVARPRPSEEFVRVLGDNSSPSFPSGHTYVAFLVLGLIGGLLVVRLRHILLRRTLMALIILAVVLVGISRVYIGAHWPSDVLGGVLAGSAVLGILLGLNRWQRPGAGPPAPDPGAGSPAHQG